MDANYQNMEELRASAPLLAGLDRNNPYEVPGDYFDSLSGSIMANIRLEQLRSIPGPYTVPAGYFDDFATAVLRRILKETSEVQEELSTIAPLLARINKTNVLSVPAGYFDHITLPATEKPRNTKIVNMGGTIRKWMTYAAAASVLFIVAISSYFYVASHESNTQTPVPIEQQIAQLNEQELTNFLKYNDGITTGDLIPAADEQDPEIQHLLQNTSDEALQNYLDEYSDPNEKTIKGI